LQLGIDADQDNTFRRKLSGFAIRLMRREKIFEGNDFSLSPLPL
jgi:hypothetical protein